MTRVLFLDVDGVLNHEQLYAALAPRRGQTTSADWIDPACVARLDGVCAELGLSLVLSSSWQLYLPRGVDEVAEVLRAHGLRAPMLGGCPARIDERPPECNPARWDAIRGWLGAHPEVPAWAILDDCAWQGFPPERFVRTRIAEGLVDGDVDRLRAVLGAQGAR